MLSIWSCITILLFFLILRKGVYYYVTTDSNFYFRCPSRHASHIILACFPEERNNNELDCPTSPTAAYL